MKRISTLSVLQITASSFNLALFSEVALVYRHFSEYARSEVAEAESEAGRGVGDFRAKLNPGGVGDLQGGTFKLCSEDGVDG